jgi:hypothetical protein
MRKGDRWAADWTMLRRVFEVGVLRPRLLSRRERNFEVRVLRPRLLSRGTSRTRASGW